MPRAISQFNPCLPLCTARPGIQSNVFADFDGSVGLLNNPSVRSKVSKENETLQQ